MREELARIMPLLSEWTGLPSRWSGTVELVATTEFYGKKPFNCDILIRTSLADDPVRWRTLIHEAIHAFSVGLTRTDYSQFTGWEEGVVEQSQRLLRKTLLQNLNVVVADEVFQQKEVDHAYNGYIQALEGLRQVVSPAHEPPELFYKTLLATPLKARPSLVWRLGLSLAGTRRADFFRLFSSASSVLKGAF